MKFKPKFMTFALAGMPHKDVEEACQVMLRSFPEVPTVPHLTMSTRMYLEGMPCLKIDAGRKVIFFDFSAGRESEFVDFYERCLSQDVDYFAISPKYNATLYKLAQILKEKPVPELKFIHFSIPGPYTFGLVIKDESGAPAFYNDTLKDVVVKQLAMKVKWYASEIKKLFPGAQVLFHIGEPAVTVYGSAGGSGSWDAINNAFNEVMAAVDTDEGITCIHCCANMDWSLLMKTNTDCIHFDAYHYGEAMSLYPGELKRFLERGGMIAWGIVPTTGGTTSVADIENENPSSLVERLEGYIQSVVDKGIDREMLLESSWIGPSCEVITLSVELAERVFDFTKEVSQRMREKYFG